MTSERVAKPVRPTSLNRPGRPDSRPMRVVYGAGALAAVSVLTVGLARPEANSSLTYEPTDDGGGLSGGAPVTDTEVRHIIRYVHLKPGQTAPPGAKVVKPDAPAPRTVVTHVAAPRQAQPRQAQPRRVVVTRQSGRR